MLEVIIALVLVHLQCHLAEIQGFERFSISLIWQRGGRHRHLVHHGLVIPHLYDRALAVGT